VAVACANIAEALTGERPADVDGGSVADDVLTSACDLASTAITDEIAAGGPISIVVAGGHCWIAAEAQLSCEASCFADASCAGASLAQRCGRDALSVMCDGSCDGTAACEGTASAGATCEGTCAGTCQGNCDATCHGRCDGSCSMTSADGQCQGACSGTCVGLCSGECSGICTGSCELATGSAVSCPGQLRCLGSECTGSTSEPRCEAELMPPSCAMDAACLAACDGQAKSGSDCTAPLVIVVQSANPVSAATLEANLPTIQAALMQLDLIGGSAADVASVIGDVCSEVASSMECALIAAGECAASTQSATEASVALNVCTSAAATVSVAALGG
jgi:hypothetical protein